MNFLKRFVKNKIEFMSTPFDNEAVDMLSKLGVKAFKIASCDITNFPLLKKIAKKKETDFFYLQEHQISKKFKMQ